MTKVPVSSKQSSAEHHANLWQLVLFMAATSLGYFVVQLDVSIVNLSLPAIRESYGIDIPALQWIANIYTLSFSVALLSAGVLGDRFGSKKFLLLGYAVFALSSLACGAAPSIGTMLAARFVQGIGAALIVPSSLAAINWAFSNNPRLRVALVTTWIAFGGAALTCGPIFGGIINSLGSWRYIFLLNLPVCAIGMWLTLRHVQPKPVVRRGRQDWLGQGLILLVSAALMLLIVNYAELSTIARVVLAAAAAIGLAMFMRIERTQINPAIPLGIFRIVGLQKALVFGVLVNFVYFGIVFFASLHFRYHLHMTVFESGMAFIPITLPLIVSTLLSRSVSNAYGPERTILVGFAFMIPGLLYLALPPLGSSYLLMLPAFLLITFGIGFIPPMVTAIAMQSVEPDRGGMISAVVNFFRQISGAFGVAIFGIFTSFENFNTSYRYFSFTLLSTAIVLIVSICFFAVRPSESALQRSG